MRRLPKCPRRASALAANDDEMMFEPSRRDPLPSLEAGPVPIQGIAAASAIPATAAGRAANGERKAAVFVAAVVTTSSLMPTVTGHPMLLHRQPGSLISTCVGATSLGNGDRVRTEYYGI